MEWIFNGICPTYWTIHFPIMEKRNPLVKDDGLATNCAVNDPFCPLKIRIKTPNRVWTTISWYVNFLFLQFYWRYFPKEAILQQPFQPEFFLIGVFSSLYNSKHRCLIVRHYLIISGFINTSVNLKKVVEDRASFNSWVICWWNRVFISQFVLLY